MKEYIKGSCKIHGKSILKYCKATRKSTGKTTEWYTCYKCLKEQWRRASEKRRKSNYAVQKYHRDYSNQYNKIRRSLSLYLTMILLACKLKPE